MTSKPKSQAAEAWKFAGIFTLTAVLPVVVAFYFFWQFLLDCAGC